MNLGRWAIGCLVAAAGGTAAVAVPASARPNGGPTRTTTSTTTNPTGTTTTSTTVAPTSPTTTGPSAPTATAGSPAVPIKVGFTGTDAVLVLGWKWSGDVSVVTSVHISGFQENGTLSATCRGSSCPVKLTREHGHMVPVHRTITAGGGQLHRFIDNLLKLRFQAGDRVVFTLQLPGKAKVSSEAVVRNGRKPLAKRLG